MNPLSLVSILPAVIASGKTSEVAEDISDAAPTLWPLLSGSQTPKAFVSSLKTLHATGKFKHLIADINSLLTVLDQELGDPAHCDEVLATIEAALPA